MATKKYLVEVQERFCKGCGICVHFCPAKILKLNQRKLNVTDADKCVGCKFCETYCPDFAITVEVKE